MIRVESTESECESHSQDVIARLASIHWNQWIRQWIGDHCERTKLECQFLEKMFDQCAVRRIIDCSIAQWSTPNEGGVKSFPLNAMWHWTDVRLNSLWPLRSKLNSKWTQIELVCARLHYWPTMDTVRCAQWDMFCMFAFKSTCGLIPLGRKRDLISGQVVWLPLATVAASGHEPVLSADWRGRFMPTEHDPEGRALSDTSPQCHLHSTGHHMPTRCSHSDNQFYWTHLPSGVTTNNNNNNTVSYL